MQLHSNMLTMAINTTQGWSASPTQGWYFEIIQHPISFFYIKYDIKQAIITSWFCTSNQIFSIITNKHPLFISMQVNIEKIERCLQQYFMTN